MTASHRSWRFELYFESNVQLACRTGVIVSGFSGERRRARSERHARRGNASPVARVSCLAFLVRFAHAFARLTNALRLRIMARCGQGGCDIVSSKYTAKTLSPSPKLEKLYSNQQRLKL